MNRSLTAELLENIQQINQIQNVFLQFRNNSDDNNGDHAGDEAKNMTGMKILEFFKELDELTQEKTFL